MRFKYGSIGVVPYGISSVSVGTRHMCKGVGETWRVGSTPSSRVGAGTCEVERKLRPLAATTGAGVAAAGVLELKQ
jgi:hypothetical protein